MWLTANLMILQNDTCGEFQKGSFWGVFSARTIVYLGEQKGRPLFMEAPSSFSAVRVAEVQSLGYGS